MDPEIEYQLEHLLDKALNDKSYEHLKNLWKDFVYNGEINWAKDSIKSIIEWEYITASNTKGISTDFDELNNWISGKIDGVIDKLK